MAAAFAVALFMASAKPAAALYWSYTFNVPGTLMESGPLTESSSPYFWLTSGGKMPIKDGIGGTVQGELPYSDSEYRAYNTMNPKDTDNGKHPQNTFRLVTKDSWGDVDERLLFRIVKTNVANSPNRDEYSGAFLMARYQDSNNLYYAGVRHDGEAVIKKKINGAYYTLAWKQVFGEEGEYHKWLRPNLLPEGQWMRMRAVFDTQDDGSVRIDLYIDRNNTGAWEQLLTATDAGTGGSPLAGEGKTGIRTDFMDMQFEDYQMYSL